MQLKNKSTRTRWYKLSIIALLAVAGAYTTVSALTTLDNSVSRAIPYLQRLWITQLGDQTSLSIVELSGGTNIKFPPGNSAVQPSEILIAPTGQLSSISRLTGGSFTTGSVTTHHILDGSLLLIDFWTNINVLAAASGTCPLGSAVVSITGGVIGTGNCLPVSTFAWTTLWGTNPCAVGYGIQGFTATGVVICGTSTIGTLQSMLNLGDYWSISTANGNDIYYGTGGSSCVSLATYTLTGVGSDSPRCGCDTNPNAIDAACATLGAFYTGNIPGTSIPSSLACIDIDTPNNIKVVHTIYVVTGVVGGTSTLQYNPSPNATLTLHTNPIRCSCDTDADNAQECGNTNTGANVGGVCRDLWVQYPASYIPWGLNGRVMRDEYGLVGTSQGTGGACTGTGRVGVGLAQPLEKLHVKLQGAAISCTTYSGSVGGTNTGQAQAAWFGGIFSGTAGGFSNCSCDIDPLTLDCQVFNSSGTPLTYPLSVSLLQGPNPPGYNPYYVYLPTPMPPNYNCVDQYVAGGLTKYHRRSTENYAETYDEIRVNSTPYSGSVTTCTTGEAAFRVDNSGLLFAPGIVMFTGGSATTTGTSVTTGTRSGSALISGNVFGYWRTYPGPLTSMGNVVNCSCDTSPSSRDCQVYDSGYTALKLAPYQRPYELASGTPFVPGIGVISNGAASGTWNLKTFFTGGNGIFYPYSGFDHLQNKIASSTGNVFGYCWERFTSGGVTWYDEYINVANRSLPAGYEFDEVVGRFTGAVGLPQCVRDITNDKIDYAFRFPFGNPVFPDYLWYNTAGTYYLGHFIPQRQGSGTYGGGGGLASVNWIPNITSPIGLFRSKMDVWIAPNRTGQPQCYDRYVDAGSTRYVHIKDALTDNFDYTVDYFASQTVNKTITIYSGIVTTGVTTLTGTPASAYRASYVGATTVSYNGANLIARTDAHVGINKQYPSTEFNVIGNVRMASLATGVMSWLSVRSNGLLTATGTVGLLSGGGYTGGYITGDYWTQGGAGVIDYNVGNVGIGTTTPTDKLQVMGDVRANNFFSNSDSALKTNIVEINTDSEYGLSKLLLIRGYTYNWISNNERGMGLIAQELMELYPDLVKTDGSGDGGDSSTPYKSVLYHSLIAPIISSISTLNDMIVLYGEEMLTQQQAAISALEARISALENPR